MFVNKLSIKNKYLKFHYVLQKLMLNFKNQTSFIRTWLKVTEMT